jgi:hypothetical protein
MEPEFGPEYATFLEWMKQLRPPMSQQYPAFGERRERWYKLVDSDILELIRYGRFDLARQRLVEISGIESFVPVDDVKELLEGLART